jgi:hypothetical protein
VADGVLGPAPPSPVVSLRDGTTDPEVSAVKRALPVLFLVASLMFPYGCATYRLRIPDDDPQVNTYQGRLVHAYFWGKWLDPQVLAAECQGEGINDVVIERTYLHDLASVLTLGIWMPLTVRFRCKAPHGVMGPLPRAPR